MRASRVLVLLSVVLGVAASASAQIRVAHWNICGMKGNAAAVQRVIAALHADDKCGWAQPVDIITLNECTVSAKTAIQSAINAAAPADTNPSSISAMANVRVPTRLICGTQDSIVPTASNGQLMYNATPAPRQLLSILNGWHCGFVDTAPAGGLGCDSGALPRAEQLAIVRRHLTAFFLLHLRGVQAHWNAVWGPQSTLDATTAVVREARARFTPSAARQAGLTGQVLDYSFTITNDGPVASSWTLAAENALWPLALSTSQTAVLAPGQSEVVHVYVTVPAVSIYANDRALVSARRDVDGATRCYARIGARRL